MHDPVGAIDSQPDKEVVKPVRTEVLVTDSTMPVESGPAVYGLKTVMGTNAPELPTGAGSVKPGLVIACASTPDKIGRAHV